MLGIWEALGTHRFKADLFGSCLVSGRHLGPTDLKQTYSDHAWYLGGTLGHLGKAKISK